MPLWRCPHCGTPQVESSRCWVCRRSTTSCADMPPLPPRCRGWPGRVRARSAAPCAPGHRDAGLLGRGRHHGDDGPARGRPRRPGAHPADGRGRRGRQQAGSNVRSGREPDADGPCPRLVAEGRSPAGRPSRMHPAGQPSRRRPRSLPGPRGHGIRRRRDQAASDAGAPDPRLLVAMGRLRALSLARLRRELRQGVQVPTTAGSDNTRSTGEPAGFFTPGAGVWPVTIHVDGMGSTPGGVGAGGPECEPVGVDRRRRYVQRHALVVADVDRRGRRRRRRDRRRRGCRGASGWGWVSARAWGSGWAPGPSRRRRPPATRAPSAGPVRVTGR